MDAKTLFEQIKVLAQQGIDLTSGTNVPAGGNLQAALDLGGDISLEAGATWNGCYIVRSNTHLIGNGAKIIGLAAGPALDILPGTNDVTIDNIIGNSANVNRVFLIGRNDSTQTKVEQAPKQIVFNQVKVPTYRGQRAFEVHGGVSLIDCEVDDCYVQGGGFDSQAVGVMNSPGEILIKGGHYSAGSECIMFGGTTNFILNMVPTNIQILNTKLFKPLTWQTDGVKRGVKNLLEFKSGENVLVDGVEFSGCWRDAQNGWAIVITPRNSLWTANITITNSVIKDAAGGISILGRNNATPTPYKTHNIQVKNNKFTVSKALYAPTINMGALVIIQGTPDNVVFNGNTYDGDGDHVSICAFADEMEADGSVTKVGKMGTIDLNTNTLNNMGKYGLIFNSVGTPWQNVVTDMRFNTNTCKSAPASTKSDFPNNTYL